MHVVRTDDAWSDWRPEGMVRRPDRWNSGQIGVRAGWHDPLDGWQGTENFSLESSAESSDITLNSGTPDKTASLQTSDFVQTQNEANNTNMYQHRSRINCTYD
jgi:hypothetical protein